MFSKIRILGLAAVASVGFVATASASSIVYSFDSTDVGAFGAGPYGTVTLVENGTGGVDFTIALRSDMNFVNTGGPHSIFSFNASGVSAGDISNILFNGLTKAGVTVVSPGGNSPFGSAFSFAIDCTVNASCANGAPGQSSDPLTFTIANSILGDFGFLVAGTTAFFAADVICVSGSCNGATGAIGVTTTSTSSTSSTSSSSSGDVPEPGPMSLTLLGLGLLGAGFMRRAKRSA